MRHVHAVEIDAGEHFVDGEGKQLSHGLVHLHSDVRRVILYALLKNVAEILELHFEGDFLVFLREGHDLLLGPFNLDRLEEQVLGHRNPGRLVTHSLDVGLLQVLLLVQVPSWVRQSVLTQKRNDLLDLRLRDTLSNAELLRRLQVHTAIVKGQLAHDAVA